MKERRYRLYYDDDDYQLRRMVNKLISHGQTPSSLRRLFEPGLHPRGIKELAAPSSLRIASAMIDLLGTLEHGTASERLAALRVVRAEALHDSGHTLRLNAARVLLQIMKEILRAKGDKRKQLGLAHDFRKVSSGKPRLIRRQLCNYHLLEMPEAWNQIAFDHHVHDANTKGRKSPTHLIMDAWIKGIRFLGVIYYNEVKAEVAAELLEAAEIMGIDVRIGVEVRARLRDKYVQLIWSPRGFLGRQDFLRFLEEPNVRRFLQEGREVVVYETRHILELLHSFNRNHLPTINEAFGIDAQPLEEDGFLESVGCGQASLVHLAEYAHRTILPYLQRRSGELLAGYGSASEAEKARIQERVMSFDRFVPETLVEEHLRPEMNPAVPDLRIPIEKNDVPLMLRLSTAKMIDKLEALPCRSRITLNPSNLSPADVLEVLYEGRGRITHLEIYNVKDWAQGRTEHRVLINEIRLVINSGNVMEAKRLVREILHLVETESHDPLLADNIRAILADLRTLLGFYKMSRLRSRLGSDSIGHSTHGRGMGLVVVPSLPWRARQEIRRDSDRILPVTTMVRRHIMVVKSGHPPIRRLQAQRDLSIEAFSYEPSSQEVTWSLGHNSTTLAEKGNIASLGGWSSAPGSNGLSRPLPPDNTAAEEHPKVGHVNSLLLNGGKVSLGFLPAFLTFYLTKEWWVLVYFGAVIWFGITGFRNILQSVIGGGGLRRSSLLNWKDLVSWNRVTDSLMFTGFSVPLLDYLVKDLLLAGSFEITTATNPIVLYSVMALANGVYISSHNVYRGLPTGAVIGNFFRTILSIPVAICLNYLIIQISVSAGIPKITALSSIQLFAAIISKTASDIVAAVIEGTADRQHNLSQRKRDYEEKLSQIYDVYGRLETAYPEQDVLTLLEYPKRLFGELEKRNNTLLRDVVIDSLDLLYFWWHQPRAQTAFKHQVDQLSSDELLFLLQSQQVLKRKRIVSKMLLEGLVGKRFERALSFYLSYSDKYLQVFEMLVSRSLSRNLRGAPDSELKAQNVSTSAEPKERS
jgi:hypothetical protein